MYRYRGDHVGQGQGCLCAADAALGHAGEVHAASVDGVAFCLQGVQDLRNRGGRCRSVTVIRIGDHGDEPLCRSQMGESEALSVQDRVAVAVEGEHDGVFDGVAVRQSCYRRVGGPGLGRVLSVVQFLLDPFSIPESQQSRIEVVLVAADSVVLKRKQLLRHLGVDERGHVEALAAVDAHDGVHVRGTVGDVPP